MVLETRGLPTNEEELKTFLAELLGEKSATLIRLEMFTYESQENVSPALGIRTEVLEECLKANEIFQDSRVSETSQFQWNLGELSLHLECGMNLSYLGYLFKSNPHSDWYAEGADVTFE